jgi:hypothetical protein
MGSNKSNERRIRVRAVRRDPPDIKKLSRALIALALAQAQAEADAQAAHETKRDKEDQPRAA